MGGPAQPSLATHWWMGRIDVWVRTTLYILYVHVYSFKLWYMIADIFDKVFHTVEWTPDEYDTGAHSLNQLRR